MPRAWERGVTMTDAARKTRRSLPMDSSTSEVWSSGIWLPLLNSRDSSDSPMLRSLNKSLVSCSKGSCIDGNDERSKRSGIGGIACNDVDVDVGVGVGVGVDIDDPVLP